MPSQATAYRLHAEINESDCTRNFQNVYALLCSDKKTQSVFFKTTGTQWIFVPPRSLFELWYFILLLSIYIYLSIYLYVYSVYMRLYTWWDFCACAIFAHWDVLYVSVATISCGVLSVKTWCTSRLVGWLAATRCDKPRFGNATPWQYMSQATRENPYVYKTSLSFMAVHLTVFILILFMCLLQWHNLVNTPWKRPVLSSSHNLSLIQW